MKILKVGLLSCSILIGIASQAFAEKKFEGVHLKMLGIGDTSVTRLVKILDQFKEETGAEVTIDMYPYPGLIDKIVVETSSPTPSYQLLWMDSPWVGQLGEAGALLDLTPLAKRDAKEMGLADIMPIQLQENTWQGKLYAIPASGMVWGMQYRKDLFENPDEKVAFKAKYGYDLDVPKTYKQYYDAAEFFTRKKGEKLAGVVLDKDFYGTAQAYSRVQGAITHDYFGIMRGFGGDFWDPKTGLCAMNGDAQIKAAEYMKSLIPFNPPDWEGLMWDLRTGYMERGEDAESLYWSVRAVRLENPKEAKIVGKAGYCDRAYRRRQAAAQLHRSFVVRHKLQDQRKGSRGRLGVHQVGHQREDHAATGGPGHQPDPPRNSIGSGTAKEVPVLQVSPGRRRITPSAGFSIRSTRTWKRLSALN